MSDLNQSFLIGNLGADPEIFTTGSGKRVLRIDVCTTKEWYDKHDQKQERKAWHRCEVWDSKKRTFNFIADYVAKGDRVWIQAEIRYESYEKDGVMKWATVLEIQDIKPAGGKLSGPKARGGSGGGGRREERRELAGASARAGSGAYDDFQAPPFEDDDDLPF
jgi:single-strand DNA-binding protein